MKLNIRPKLSEPVKESTMAQQNYFTTHNKPNLRLIKSGCTVLDCVLGGGYPLGRISNIVGDSSSGKTLLAIEGCANFISQFEDGKIYYNESEAAFDEHYAESIGMPIDKVTFVEGQDHTIEGLFEHFEEIIENHKKDKPPTLYIVDSLDGLSDRAEQKRAIDEGSYGMMKQKKLSEFFRRKVSDIEKSNIHLMIISQVRDNIGVAFGEKHTRTGGKSLNFYASQVVWLATAGRLKRVIKKIERVYGVNIKANCKKNKVGLPFRTCEFPIIFGYGINDIVASLEFLNSIGETEKLTVNSDLWKECLEKYKDLKGTNSIKLTEFVNSKFDTEYEHMINTLQGQVIQSWSEIETEFLPTHKKRR